MMNDLLYTLTLNCLLTKVVPREYEINQSKPYFMIELAILLTMIQPMPRFIVINNFVKLNLHRPRKTQLGKIHDH